MSLAECTALLFQAVNENSVSLIKLAKRTYSEHQLQASLVQCNEEGETPLVIAMRGKNDRVIYELVKVLRNCDKTNEENQLKLSIAIQQLSHQIPIVELIGYLASALQDTCLKNLNSSYITPFSFKTMNDLFDNFSNKSHFGINLMLAGHKTLKPTKWLNDNT